MIGVCFKVDMLQIDCITPEEDDGGDNVQEEMDGIERGLL